MCTQYTPTCLGSKNTQVHLCRWESNNGEPILKDYLVHKHELFEMRFSSETEQQPFFYYSASQIRYALNANLAQTMGYCQLFLFGACRRTPTVHHEFHEETLFLKVFIQSARLSFSEKSSTLLQNSQDLLNLFRTFWNLSELFRTSRHFSAHLGTSRHFSALLGTFRNFSELYLWILAILV